MTLAELSAHVIALVAEGHGQCQVYVASDAYNACFRVTDISIIDADDYYDHLAGEVGIA